ncbi:MAG: hypothetical protein JWN16_907 [Alphaproteobacteria bacterium]|nr:hypothetical protein [Alphaproteobacteria bacterium]
MRGRPAPGEIFKEVALTRHRLMLSAAAAALLAAGATMARADTEISTSTSTALSTSTSGNITIDSTGGVGIATAATPAVTINSGNFVLNNGFIANNGVDTGIGLKIDTTAGAVLSPSGFASTGTIDLGGGGTTKEGIWITGGGTFYGPITLTSLTTTALTGTAAVTQQSSILVKGDNSTAFLLDAGTNVTSNILLGGGGILYNASDNSTASNSIMVFLNGTVNGNVIINSALSGTGAGLIGLETLGGIHSCLSDTAAPAGFTCPVGATGALINAGTISLIGISVPNSRGNNPEAGSALIIGNSVDGGFINAGPGTSSNATVAVISSSGLVTSGVVQPVMLIDPTKSITGTLLAPRSALFLGPLTNAIDAIDPGYSFSNRGSILARPIDTGLSTSSLVIQGASAAFNTCLSASVGACTGINSDPTTNGGGFLNTGTISAIATTGQTDRSGATRITSNAVYIGAFATVPRLDVKSEVISGSTTTPGIISAQVSGIGQGSAFALTIGANAVLPVINVGKGASITATVDTSTVSPTSDIATASAPFTLFSEAILDQSGTVKMVNNAGTIRAANTVLTPQSGATALSVQRAIDLQASTTGGTVINNSGNILGDVLFGTAGNNNVLNVGNIGASGSANAVTGVANTPSSYAVLAETVLNQTSGLPPLTDAAILDFGSGTGNVLHVGGYGYVNAVINSGVGALDVQVDSNGILYVANNSSSLQANNFNVAANGTLGLSIAQANVNSLTPVVQANSATLSGANLALQFGTYISSGFTAASVATPTEQTITLLRAPTITDTTLANQNALLAQNTPFLFESPSLTGGRGGPVPLQISTDAGGQQTLLLHLLPRSVNATNTDGTPGLNLSGNARNQFPFVASALSTDNELGSAIASSMTVYNTPGLASSGINIAASQQQAQQVFSQFAPDVSGGTREIAIMLTDQATGPVAARQRLLRSYSNVSGDMTLWGQEFAGHINNKGATSGSGDLTSYKDHGFGFTLGVDAGSPRNGWYGGAFTFYSGDVSQLLPRATKTQTEWYMLTGYTEWKGKHFFLDTTASAAYGNFSETRSLIVGNVARFATSKRPGAMLALGANAGMIAHVLGGVEIDPHVSLDGMTLREEGYTEGGGGPGLNLAVAPYFASSMRTAVGADVKGTISVFGIDLTPEGRLGYRYDLLHQAVKIRAAFDSTGGLGTAGNTMTFIGPDPDSGNVFTGLSLGAGTDTWHLGVNYDWIRGDNGSTTQVGTLTVLGRI